MEKDKVTLWMWYRTHPARTVAKADQVGLPNHSDWVDPLKLEKLGRLITGERFVECDGTGTGEDGSKRNCSAQWGSRASTAT